MRIAWLTDPHLDFIGKHQIAAFCQAVNAERPDATVITGDITVFRHLRGHLKELDKHLERPCYFVLGNHDAYGAAVCIAQHHAVGAAARSERLVYLSHVPYVELEEGLFLVGHDGWYDGRLGLIESSRVELNDFEYIAEMQHRMHRPEQMRRLARRGAEHVKHGIDAAARAGASHIIVATHVPPFKEACWHEGGISDNEWLPYFASATMGEVLADAAHRHPIAFTVLCGHTHSPGTIHPYGNMTVHTGLAVYGAPRVRILELLGTGPCE